MSSVMRRINDFDQMSSYLEAWEDYDLCQLQYQPDGLSTYCSHSTWIMQRLSGMMAAAGCIDGPL